MNSSNDDAERLREIRAYEEFEAEHRAKELPASRDVNHQRDTAFWARWCAICLTVMAGLELLKQLGPFILLNRY